MSKYTKKDREMQGRTIVLIAIILAVLAGLALNQLFEEDAKVKPDVSYPMTNVNISWEQTYHPGPWGG